MSCSDVPGAQVSAVSRILYDRNELIASWSQPTMVFNEIGIEPGLSPLICHTQREPKTLHPAACDDSHHRVRNNVSRPDKTVVQSENDSSRIHHYLSQSSPLHHTATVLARQISGRGTCPWSCLYLPFTPKAKALRRT
jgi:hypothetical protein